MLCHTPALELWVQNYARRHVVFLVFFLSARRHEVHICRTPALELWVQSFARRHALPLALILSAQKHEVLVQRKTLPTRLLGLLEKQSKI